MNTAQKKFIKEIAALENFSLDELIAKLRYEVLKASYVSQYLDDNIGTRRSYSKIVKDFEEIMARSEMESYLKDPEE
jgi:hypothetical protein